MSWKNIKEKGSLPAIKLLAIIANYCGRPVIVLLLYPIIFYYVLTAKAAVNSSKQFLQKATQQKVSFRQVFKHFMTFACVSVDRFFILKSQLTKFDVLIEENDIFELVKKKGCMLVTSHLGSFDVMRALATYSQNVPIKILLDVKHNANLLKLFQELNPDLAKQIIDTNTPAPQLALELNEAINNSFNIGAMVDRCNPNESTVELEFLGNTAQFPMSAWQFASVLKVPVVACFGIYLGNRQYRLEFKLISENLGATRKERTQVVQHAIFEYVKILEDFAVKYPYNWFNFYDFWQNESSRN
jgi:predicted LPLAT superfamily acyltransferase